MDICICIEKSIACIADDIICGNLACNCSCEVIAESIAPVLTDVRRLDSLISLRTCVCCIELLYEDIKARNFVIDLDSLNAWEIVAVLAVLDIVLWLEEPLDELNSFLFLTPSNA